MFFGESVSPIVYHYTSLVSAKEILRRMEFRLSSSFSNDSEDIHRPQSNKHYFLSVARNPSAAYHKSATEGVIFVLNGDYFNQRYRSRPVDYFASVAMKSGSGNTDRYKPKGKPKGQEFEDRIFSDTPTIPISKDAILEIHIATPTEYKSKDMDSDLEQRRKHIYAEANALGKEIWLISKKLGIPTWIYETQLQSDRFRSKNDFSLLRKSGAISPDAIGFTQTSGIPNFRHGKWSSKAYRDSWSVPFGTKIRDGQRYKYAFRLLQTQNPNIRPRKSDVLGPTLDHLIFWRELYYKNSFEDLSPLSQFLLQMKFGMETTGPKHSKPTHDPKSALSTFKNTFESDWGMTVSARTEESVRIAEKMKEIFRKMHISIDDFPNKMYNKWKSLYFDELGK